ncbi:hypothetical protein Y032_0002g812 [Ancylostoma ceylanicum]|nr:hypothetical protein Y032_0002g812 [Ancylostoma ceylanicum]
MIQINIFDATTQDLRASGLDLEKCLDMLGFRSVLMDIVIPPTDSSGLPTEPFDPPPNTANSPTEPLDCSEVDNNETVQVEKVKRKGRRRSATQARKKGVRRMTKPRKNKLDKPIKSRTSNPKSSCELCRDHIYAVEDSIPSIHGDSATEGCQVVPQRHEPDVAIHKRKRRRISSTFESTLLGKNLCQDMRWSTLSSSRLTMIQSRDERNSDFRFPKFPIFRC